MTDIHGLKPNVRPNTPYNVTAQIRGDIRQIVQREIEQVTIGTIGAETPAGAQAKVDASALSLTAAIAAAKAELLAADALLAPLVHTHDDRYYLKSQVEAALSGKAALVHTHHDLYYVKSEIDALLVGTGAVHNHNDLYYLKSEISAFLSGKAAAVHSHDDRYFTESEVNSLLAGKAAAVHSHNDLYYTEAEVDALIAGVSGGAGWTPVAASTSVQGIVELATVAETTTGTDGSLAVTPPGLRAVLDARGLLYAPALGADDNYVTDAEKAALHTHPAVIAQGATQADARTAIGAGTSSFSGAYADLTGKPTLGTASAAATGDFAPASHAHAQSDITGLTDALAGKAATSHNHAASEITSGTVATARLGSGTPSAATFLRGDQTWAAPSGGALIVPNTFPDSIYALGGGPVTSAGLELSADKVYLTAYNLAAGAKVRRLVLIVTTAPSQAVTVECGIWSSTAQKVVSATLSISTTGRKEIDLGSVQSLAPDTYWLCTKVLGTNAYGLVLGREYQPEAVITPRGNAWDAPDGLCRGLSGTSSGTGAIATDLSGLTLAMEAASIGYGYRVA